MKIKKNTKAYSKYSNVCCWRLLVQRLDENVSRSSLQTKVLTPRFYPVSGVDVALWFFYTRPL